MNGRMRLVLGCALALGAAQAGCYGNSATPFPPGLEPWEAENVATLPAAVGDDPCPELDTLEVVRGSYTETETGRIFREVHAAACIHAPLADVFRAARDPQTGRDPTATQGFRVTAYETETDYDWSYQTHVTANTTAGITPEFDLNWRHGVVEGTAEEPEVTATRWKKTFGNEAISLLEGSLVLRPLQGHPEITEVRYQYHLEAVTANHDTIINYLNVIYGRLRQGAHGETLVPNDCVDCPAPPAGY